MTKRTVLIYGGSFWPITIGHESTVNHSLEYVDGVDEVLVIPVFEHVMGKVFAGCTYDDRVEMAARTFAANSRVTVSRIEQELGGPSWSMRLVEHLVKTHGHDTNFRFMVGVDCAVARHQWGSDWDAIDALAPMLIVNRTGYEYDGDVLNIPIPDISSTQIRALFAEGKFKEARALVPAPAFDYIVEHQLFGYTP